MNELKFFKSYIANVAGFLFCILPRQASGGGIL